MDDPFGDPFAEPSASVAPAAASASSTKKPAGAIKPATTSTANVASNKNENKEQKVEKSAPSASSSSVSSVSSSSSSRTPIASSSAAIITDPFASDDIDSHSASASVSKPIKQTPVVDPAPPAQSSPQPKLEPVVDTPVVEEAEASPQPIEETDKNKQDDVKPAPAAAISPLADDDAFAAAVAESAAAVPAPVSTPSDAPVTSSSTSSVIAALASSYFDDDDTGDDELTLESQNLTGLPSDISETLGGSLRRIDLTSNHLRDLSSFAWGPSAVSTHGSAPWPILEEIILDKNWLNSVEGLPLLPRLTTLWLNNNKITDIEPVLDHLEKHVPNLSYLSVLRNPCTPDAYFGEGEMESYARYRLYVIYRLKKLQFLDSTPVTIEERKEATLRGAYCRVAKPTDSSSSSSSGGKNSSGTTEDQTPTPTTRQSVVGVDKTLSAKPPKVATFLAKGKPRYDGTNSEGNRFIMNEDL